MPASPDLTKHAHIIPSQPAGQSPRLPPETLPPDEPARDPVRNPEP